MDDLQKNGGTITTREELEYRGDRRPPALQLGLSSSLNRKRPASPVSLADLDSGSRRGSFKRRVLRSDVFAPDVTDEYPQTPTVPDETQDGSLSRASTPASEVAERGAPAYASPHVQGLADLIMDGSFPNVEATNEDGMLSPDHAMSLPSPTLSPAIGFTNSAQEYFGSPTHVLNRSPTP